MTQHNDPAVSADVLVRFADWMVRAVVVVVLLFAYLAWMERDPIAALPAGGVVLIAVSAWHRVTQAPEPEMSCAAGPAPISIADVDRMTCRELQLLVASLLRRDDVGGVHAPTSRVDLSSEVLGHTSTGRSLLVRCHRDAPRRRVGATAVHRFLDDTHGARATDIPVLVTTGRFTRSALALGDSRGLVLLDRTQLAAWLTGRPTRLSPHLAV